MSADARPNPALGPRAGVMLSDVIHGTGCLWRVTTFEAGRGPIAVLYLSGDLDLFTRSTLPYAMAHVLAARPHALVVDLGRLDFCGVREAAMLHAGSAAHGECGTRYALSTVPAHMKRLVSRLWSAGGPSLYPSAPVAVAAIRAN